MANHESAKKEDRKKLKRNLINKSRLSDVKTAIKKVLSAATSGDKTANELFVIAQKKIDQASTKGIFKKNTASRKISRLSALVKRSQEA